MSKKLQSLLMFLLIMNVARSWWLSVEKDCRKRCKSASSCKCSRMDLTSIPQNLPPNIFELFLANNQIRSLRASDLTRYRDLTTLDLDSSHITGMIHSDTFSNLRKLGWLHLQCNQITNIQSGTFADLPNLRTLFLFENRITLIQPATSSNLPKLTMLDLHDNQITNIQPGAFLNLPKLTRLTLHRNEITHIQRFAFSNLANLDTLSLLSNKIIDIHPDAFLNLHKLYYLNLGKNSILEIEPNTFSNLPQLQTLYLGLNQISVLPLSAFNILASVTLADVSHNPWQCDCRMLPFRLKMNGSHSFENQIVCSQPARFSGQKLKDINPNDLACKVVTTPTMVPLTTLSVNPSKVSLPIDTQFERGNSYNGKTNHISTSVIVYTTFTPLPVHLSTPESNSSHDPAPSFPIPVLIASLCGLAAGIALAGVTILTIWCKRRAKNPPSCQRPKVVLDDRGIQIQTQLAALQPNPLYNHVQTHIKQYKTSDDVGSAQSLEDPSVGLTRTNTTKAVVTSDHDHQYEDIDAQYDQKGQGQSRVITEGMKTTTTVVTSGHDQAGPSQSQTSIECNTKTTAVSVISARCHDQTGQSKFQAITESNTNTTAVAATSGHDHIGHCQAQATLDYEKELLHRSLTCQTEPVELESNSKCTNDQTVQGQSQAIAGELLDGRNPTYNTQPETSDLNRVYGCTNDQTGQGQIQAAAVDLLEGRNLTYDTEPETSDVNRVYECTNDQTGQGQSEAIIGELLDGRNLTYNTEPDTLELNRVYECTNDEAEQGQPR